MGKQFGKIVRGIWVIAMHLLTLPVRLVFLSILSICCVVGSVVTKESLREWVGLLWKGLFNGYTCEKTFVETGDTTGVNEILKR